MWSASPTRFAAPRARSPERRRAAGAFVRPWRPRSSRRRPRSNCSRSTSSSPSAATSATSRRRWNEANNNDRVVVMPGEYLEEPSRKQPTNDPKCKRYAENASERGAGAATYRYQVKCPNDQNLHLHPGARADQEGRSRSRRSTVAAESRSRASASKMQFADQGLGCERRRRRGSTRSRAPKGTEWAVRRKPKKDVGVSGTAPTGSQCAT